jgi:hypothetical protein
MLEAFFFAESFFAASSAGADFAAGSSSGKVLSRLRPEASFSEEGVDGGAGGEAGAGFCCANTTLLNPSSNPNHNQRRMGHFTAGSSIFENHTTGR